MTNYGLHRYEPGKVGRCDDCEFEAYEIIFEMDKEKLDSLVKQSWDWSYAE